MAQAVKTLVAVVVLTLLIWFYADQASSESDIFAVWLTTRPPGSAKWRIADPNMERTQVEVEFAGPTGAMRELLRDVQDDRFRLTYVVEADPPSGPYVVDLIRRLDGLEEVQRRGLRVTNVRPPELTLQVDRFVTKELPVVAQADSYKIVQPTVQPATVKVILPESQFDKLDRAEIAANIEAMELHRTLIREHLQSSAESRQALELYDVPLTRPPGAILDPQRVLVTAVIERRDRTRSLRSVYVKFEVSSDQWRKYDLAVKDNADLALEITVKGPSDTIASLTPQDVRAYVEISTNDAIKTEGWLTRTVSFVLPPGVLLDQTAPQIQFRLVEKGKAASAGLMTGRE